MLGNTKSAEDANAFKHFASELCKMHLPLSLTVSKVYNCAVVKLA